MLLASLPAAAALITTLLGQFQVRELWELRESGRIRLNELIIEASLIGATTDVEMRSALSVIDRKRVEMQREQSSRFFSTIGGAGGAGKDEAIPQPQG